MRKIEEVFRKSYELTSVTEREFTNCKKGIKTFYDELDAEIQRLEDRLDELKEVKSTKSDIVYLIKDTDSNYSYIDENLVNYKYLVMNDKPMLVNGKTFEVFEIIEYCDVKYVQSVSNKSYVVSLYIDKVVKIKRLGKEA